jgi:dynein heavy chain
MVVGQAFSGKSTVIEILRLAFGYLKGKGEFVPARSFKLNPKAITSDQLYGKLDPITKSWFDGVIAIIMRQCAQDIDVP